METLRLGAAARAEGANSSPPTSEQAPSTRSVRNFSVFILRVIDRAPPGLRRHQFRGAREEPLVSQPGRLCTKRATAAIAGRISLRDLLAATSLDDIAVDG